MEKEDTTPFAHTDYKIYLNRRLDGDPRGRRSAFARAIGCQPAYLSSVLRGPNHFTPEQGEAINEHLHHSESESNYFLLLLQLQRAGTDSLRRRLRKQLERIQNERFVLKDRLSVPAAMTFEDQATYYSEWYYAAIHALVSIEGFQNPGVIARRLKLEPTKTEEALAFLLRCGILERRKGQLRVGQARIHLGSESPLISKHHINWRLVAMQKLGQSPAGEAIHYSSAVTLARTDADRLRELIVRAIKDAKTIVRDSKEEQLCAFNVDFFEI